MIRAECVETINVVTCTLLCAGRVTEGNFRVMLVRDVCFGGGGEVILSVWRTRRMDTWAGRGVGETLGLCLIRRRLCQKKRQPYRTDNMDLGSSFLRQTTARKMLNIFRQYSLDSGATVLFSLAGYHRRSEGGSQTPNSQEKMQYIPSELDCADKAHWRAYDK